MKSLLSATLVAASVLTMGGTVTAVAVMAEHNRQQTPSPVIHGSSDQTITPAPTPYSPRHKLPGYPISRLPEGTAK